MQRNAAHSYIKVKILEKDNQYMYDVFRCNIMVIVLQ